MIEKHDMLSSQQMKTHQNKFIEITFILLFSQIHIIWKKKYYYNITVI